MVIINKMYLIIDSRYILYAFNYFFVFDRMMFAAGSLAAVCSIAYPAISAYVSNYTEADKQGEFERLLGN